MKHLPHLGLALALLAGRCGGGSPSPDGGHLTVAEACETFVSHGEACGTYSPGSLGGTDRATDIARCTTTYERLEDQCHRLLSDFVRCDSGGCGDAVAHCRPLLDGLTRICGP